MYGAFELSFKINRFAFTLAEVLITLGIIGVVATMTIPTLMNNINDAQYKTAYKKAYTILSQALINARQQDLIVEVVVISGARPTDVDTNFLAIMSQFKTVKQCISGTDKSSCWALNEDYRYPQPNSYAFIDTSGMAWTEYHAGEPEIFVDTNAFKGPNQWGKDRFAFYLEDINNNSSTGYPIKVLPYADNVTTICYGTNKCATENNYYGTTWLFK